MTQKLLEALKLGIAEAEHIAIAGSYDNLREGQKRVADWLSIARQALSDFESHGGWMPIESAPKVADGTKYLVWGRAFIAQIDNDDDRGSWGDWGVMKCYWLPSGQWGLTTEPRYVDVIAIQATHWQPLPKPPEAG